MFCYLNHIILNIIILPFEKEISCKYLHAPQRLSPHPRSPTPAEYGTGTTLAPEALEFLHVITHVLTEEHMPEPKQLKWGGLSSFFIKKLKKFSSYDMPAVVPVAATTNYQCSDPLRTIF